MYSRLKYPDQEQDLFCLLPPMDFPVIHNCLSICSITKSRMYMKFTNNKNWCLIRLNGQSWVTIIFKNMHGIIFYCVWINVVVTVVMKGVDKEQNKLDNWTYSVNSYNSRVFFFKTKQKIQYFFTFVDVIAIRNLFGKLFSNFISEQGPEKYTWLIFK